jgi:hypothetical protein
VDLSNSLCALGHNPGVIVMRSYFEKSRMALRAGAIAYVRRNRAVTFILEIDTVIKEK